MQVNIAFVITRWSRADSHAWGDILEGRAASAADGVPRYVSP
jgi:hypothetical protein